MSTIVDRVRNNMRATLIIERLEDTFGPNPCDQLHLTNTDTGETLHLTCNTKRCIHCGPRKKFLLQHQTEHLGKHVYIARLEDLDDINRGIEAAKKRKARNGEDFRYTIVGDATLGYIVVSDVQLIPDQRFMELREWMGRILDIYHHSVQRIRRSRVLGRMSLVTLTSSRANRDIPSPWYRRTLNTDLYQSVEGLDWADLLAEMNHMAGETLERPPQHLPIPF